MKPDQKIKNDIKEKEIILEILNNDLDKLKSKILRVEYELIDLRNILSIFES